MEVLARKNSGLFELVVIARLRESEEGMFSMMSLEEINEHTGVVLVVTSEVILRTGDRYVRLSFVRAPRLAHD